MNFSSQLITDLISLINSHDVLSEYGKAIRAYDTPGLPVPINETYFSFSCRENAVSLASSQQPGNTLTVRMNCYFPLSKAVHLAHDITEKTAWALAEASGEAMKSFCVGDTEYDDDIKSYKISVLMIFSYDI